MYNDILSTLRVSYRIANCPKNPPSFTYSCSPTLPASCGRSVWLYKEIRTRAPGGLVGSVSSSWFLLRSRSQHPVGEPSLSAESASLPTSLSAPLPMYVPSLSQVNKSLKTKQNRRTAFQSGCPVFTAASNEWEFLLLHSPSSIWCRQCSGFWSFE